MILDNIYLSCSLPTTDRVVGARNFTEYSNHGNSRLLPLGIALVELSVRKSLNKLIEKWKSGSSGHKTCDCIKTCQNGLKGEWDKLCRGCS